MFPFEEIKEIEQINMHEMSRAS